MHLLELRDQTLEEASRIMTICNSCRYCEGICAVFPAMELRTGFAAADLDYLANLCHGCGACFADCQYAPPHEFAVAVPATLATLRTQSYEAYAWPAPLSALYRRNGMVMTAAAVLAMAGFITGFVAANDPGALFASDARFYRLMPHDAMAWLFGAAFAYASLALAMAVRNFWRAIGGGTLNAATVMRACADSARLKYLDGGGGGCVRHEDQPSDMRRLYHHATFYGFLLCFAATSVATLYHYLLGLEAPYRWFDLPVSLGTLGGLGLVIGTIGLAMEKRHRDPALRNDGPIGTPFLTLLGLTGATGLALLVLRATPAMGIVLALHLGLVFALFITLPYGKFVHGFYRLASLIKYAGEQH